MFVNEKILEEYSVKVYKINPYFQEHYKKKKKKRIQVVKNGFEHIFFITDDYFNEYILAVEAKKYCQLIKNEKCTIKNKTNAN